jgi:hypothetical protein
MDILNRVGHALQRARSEGTGGSAIGILPSTN